MSAITEQQKLIIDKGVDGGSVKAFAGTGKTTTLLRLCEAHQNKRFLYLAYNRQIKLEADAKFPTNTNVSTVHGLAYGVEAAQYKHRLGNRNISPLQVAEKFGGNYYFAGLALATMRKFMNSEDAQITDDHALQVWMDKNRDPSKDPPLRTMVQNAKAIWADAIKPDSDLPFEHDMYLKLAQLNNSLAAKLNSYDLVLVDEAQDLNPSMLGIVRQSGARALAVGDPHQAIYGWRGAKNALDDFQGERFLLSHSFRFGPDTALMASMLLERFRDEKDELVGRGGDTKIHFDKEKSSKQQQLIIARTNAELIEQAALAVDNKTPFHFVGGIRNDLFAAALGVWGVMENDKELANKHPTTKYFYGVDDNWSQLRSYAENGGDAEIRSAIGLAEDHNVPDLIGRVKNANQDSADNSIENYITAHRSKGLEHDRVLLCNDFNTFEENDDREFVEDGGFTLLESGHQEVNLLYVAITRAQKELHVNESVRDWMFAEAQHEENLKQRAELLKTAKEPDAAEEKKTPPAKNKQQQGRAL